jgi:hypothetical protein
VGFEEVAEVNESADKVFLRLGPLCHEQIGQTNVVVQQLFGKALQNGEDFIELFPYPIDDGGYIRVQKLVFFMVMFVESEQTEVTAFGLDGGVQFDDLFFC